MFLLSLLLCVSPFRRYDDEIWQESACNQERALIDHNTLGDDIEEDEMGGVACGHDC